MAALAQRMVRPSPTLAGTRVAAPGATEAYLAEAVDLYDLDRRMRDLDREERARFIGYF